MGTYEVCTLNRVAQKGGKAHSALRNCSPTNRRASARLRARRPNPSSATTPPTGGGGFSASTARCVSAMVGTANAPCGYHMGTIEGRFSVQPCRRMRSHFARTRGFLRFSVRLCERLFWRSTMLPSEWSQVQVLPGSPSQRRTGRVCDRLCPGRFSRSVRARRHRPARRRR